MDFTLLFDPQYLPIIVGTLVGFAALAAALLVPVYRFLERERKVAKKWTPEAIARRLRERRDSAPDETAEASDGEPEEASGTSPPG